MWFWIGGIERSQRSDTRRIVQDLPNGMLSKSGCRAGLGDGGAASTSSIADRSYLLLNGNDALSIDHDVLIFGYRRIINRKLRGHNCIRSWSRVNPERPRDRIGL